LDATIEDFWRMIWEQQCSVIVMVTNLQEGGRVKCAQYWPEVGRHRVFGKLHVKTADSKLKSGYIINTIHIRRAAKVCWLASCITTLATKLNHTPVFFLQDTATPRIVKHYWINSWPDHGVPQSSDVVFTILEEARRDRSPPSGPMVVHCSAGCGKALQTCF
jgi:protein tyrosine phosphatase